MQMNNLVKPSLTTHQYQQVMDAYGIGQLERVVLLPAVFLAAPRPTDLNNELVTTICGTFLLSHAPNESIHDLWWESPTEEAFPLSLMDSMKLTYVQPLATRQGCFTVHRFDRRFTLFAL